MKPTESQATAAAAAVYPFSLPTFPLGSAQDVLRLRVDALTTVRTCQATLTARTHEVRGTSRRIRGTTRRRRRARQPRDRNPIIPRGVPPAPTRPVPSPIVESARPGSGRLGSRSGGRAKSRRALSWGGLSCLWDCALYWPVPASWGIHLEMDETTCLEALDRVGIRSPRSVGVSRDGSPG